MKPDVLEQLRLIIVQTLVERMKIPIPTITMDKPDLEFRLANMILSVKDLLPERIVMENSGRYTLDLSDIKRRVGTQNEGETLRLVMYVKSFRIVDNKG